MNTELFTTKCRGGTLFGFSSVPISSNMMFSELAYYSFVWLQSVLLLCCPSSMYDIYCFYRVPLSYVALASHFWAEWVKFYYRIEDGEDICEAIFYLACSLVCCIEWWLFNGKGNNGYCGDCAPTCVGLPCLRLGAMTLVRNLEYLLTLGYWIMMGCFIDIVIN